MLGHLTLLQKYQYSINHQVINSSLPFNDILVIVSDSLSEAVLLIKQNSYVSMNYCISLNAFSVF